MESKVQQSCGPKEVADEEDIYKVYLSLTRQASSLLSELEALQTFITSNSSWAKRPDGLLTKFRTDVQREADLLDKHGRNLTTPDESDCQAKTNANDAASLPPNFDVQLHQIRSSNISHLDFIWQEAKNNDSVKAVRKHIRYVPGCLPFRPDVNVSGAHNAHARSRAKANGESLQNGPRVPRSAKGSVTVDIVGENGSKWIKMFTKTQRWLLMDMAKEGLVDLGWEDTSDDGETSNTNAALDDLKICKMAREFFAASRSVRVNHRHPIVHFHLPKISRGVSKDIDLVVDYIERLGIVVLTADKMHVPEVTSPPLDLTFRRMLQHQVSSKPLTAILNLDCTILIALISEISHYSAPRIAIPSHYDGRLARQDIEVQMESEKSDPLLSNHIYPLLRGKQLVCTEKAAAHLRNIVTVMGSEGETKRSNILLHYDDLENEHSSAEIKHQFQSLSSHVLPRDVNLPVRVVDDTMDDGSKAVSSQLDHQVMEQIARQPRLSPLNRSVFFNGWKKSLTTISLNKVVSEWMERAIDAALDVIEFSESCDEDEDVARKRHFEGPHVLICGRERSLLGNDKP